LVRREGVTPTGQSGDATVRILDTHVKDIDRDARKAIYGVREGVGQDYYAHRASKVDPAQRFDTRIEVAALLRVDGVVGNVEDAATDFVKEHLTKFSVAIKHTTGATRDAYRKVQEQTTTPDAVTIELRDNEKTATLDGDGQPLPQLSGHLYADAAGLYPVDLNAWETEVVTAEIARPNFIAWYRNPARALSNALRIAYKDDAGKWASLQVDFLVIARKDDGALSASIIDPHGDHLADARAKLRSLASFAAEYGQHFVRIESVARSTSGVLRVLDLLDSDVRSVVEQFEGGKVSALYDSDHARDFA
jgi:hypothetical protein